MMPMMPGVREARVRGQGWAIKASTAGHGSSGGLWRVVEDRDLELQKLALYAQGVAGRGLGPYSGCHYLSVDLGLER
jgi:hypothetical protein